ncbi:hypothetical protein FKM82_007976 [Ascaphus truei]
MRTHALWLLFLSVGSAGAAVQRKALPPPDIRPVSISSAVRDPHVFENTTSSLDKIPSKGTSTSVMAPARSSSLESSTSRGHLSSADHQGQKDEGELTMPPDKKTKAKLALDNNTGLRMVNVPRTALLSAGIHRGVQLSSPAYGNSHHFQLDRLQPGGTRISSSFHHASSLHHKARSLTDSQHLQDPKGSRTNGYDTKDHENNRPRKVTHYKHGEALRNSSKPSWMTNRQPSSLLYQFNAFKRDSDSKERICLAECHKEKDERESFCNSDFAVNGIVHNVETLSTGRQLITLLVNSDGLYKMNRLYITPDGFFFRVKILAVDTLGCHKACLDFKLGSRYIVMGQVYHRRMELPRGPQQQLLGGRLRSGDGLVRSGSYVRRFNRRKSRKVLTAVHAKCR